MTKRKAVELSRFELSDLVGDFLSDYESGPPKTLAYYRDNVGRALFNYLSGRGIDAIEDVTPQVLREWLIHEADQSYDRKGHVRRMSPRTVVGRHTAARRFFSWCVEQEIIPKSPMDMVRAPKAPEDAVVGFTDEEVERLIRESGKAWGWLAARDRAIVTTLLGTGARADELLRMTEDSIEWGRQGKGGRITLHGKGGKIRRVPMGHTTAKAIKRYLRDRPDPRDDALWITLRRTPMNYGALNMMLKHLGEYSGVEGVTPHRFRHTYASQWWTHHRDILALKNLLGHSRIVTTERYLRSLGHEYGTDHTYETPDNWLA